MGEIRKDLIFRQFIFEGLADFQGCIFEGSVFSNFASFIDGAWFHSAVFNGAASFSSVKFGREAGFSSVTFKGDAWFRATNFSSYASFSYSTFGQNAGFEAALFNDSASFMLTVFGGGARFQSATFAATSDFSGARFLTHVPEFYAASLYEDTVFPIPEDYRANWPPLSGEVEDKEVMEATQQKRAYSRLRLFMDKGLQIDEAQFFHRMEMRAKRQTEGRAYRWLYSAFALLSDYGNSVLRPVGWLFAVLMAGWPFMLWHLQGESAATGAQFATALGWSLSNTLPFSGFGRVYYSGFAEGLPIWLKVIGGAQVIAAMVLLFLLGLGLRNRFRLR